MNELRDQLRKIALQDGRYSPDAFVFLFESLDVAMRMAGKEGRTGASRHVTGQEVLAGMREHALARFGPLAAQVWRQWGIRETLDWGKVVFLLIDHDLLKRQDEDKLEDFRDGYDFDEAFVASYGARLASALAASGSKEAAP